MFGSPDKRRLLILGLVTIILSALALVNNLLEFEGEIWLTMLALAVSFLLFVWGYWADRAVYGAIGAYVTLAIMLLIIGTNWLNLEGVIVPTYVLAAIALPFIVTWWLKREFWGFLIPAYVLLAIIPILYMSGDFNPAFVPSYVMLAIAVPFFATAAISKKWPFLIPAYVLVAIIPIFFMNEDVNPQLIPAYVLTAIALPFLVTYVVSHKWGWLVPSFILLVIAASFFAVSLGMTINLINIGLPLLALLGGVALLVRAMMQQEPEDKQKI